MEPIEVEDECPKYLTPEEHAEFVAFPKNKHRPKDWSLEKSKLFDRYKNRQRGRMYAAKMKQDPAWIEKEKQRNRNYDNAHRDERKEKAKLYRQEHPEKAKKAQKKYRAKFVMHGPKNREMTDEEKEEEEKKKKAKRADNERKRRRDDVDNLIYKRRKLGPNRVWEMVSASAKGKNLDLQLTKEEIIEIGKHDCFYCGVENCRGIDRVDNKLGYVKDNLVPCCTACNYAKRDMTQGHFFAACNKIACYLLDGLNDDLKRSNVTFAKKRKLSYPCWLKRCKRRKIDCELERVHYLRMQEEPCSFCGVLACRGIDRRDPSGGYTLKNVQPCCMVCNYMKHSLPHDDFVSLIMSIHKKHGEYGIIWSGETCIVAQKYII